MNAATYWSLIALTCLVGFLVSWDHGFVTGAAAGLSLVILVSVLDQVMKKRTP